MEERDLIRGLRARDEQAVRAYLERYRPLFQHCISHFESDTALREDLFQELVWHALERLDQDTFDEERGSFGTWLYRVAWCRCVDLKRQQGARRRVKLSLSGENSPERSDPAAGPGEAAGTEEIGAAVRAALSRLESEQQSLLCLRFQDGRTLAEIAEELGISLEQVKYRVKRASIDLRRELLADIARETVSE